MDPALDKASAYPQETGPTPGAPAQTQPPRPADDFRWRVFLEPRGFLRLIEFVLAVCMFATTAGYATSFSFTASCAMGHTYSVTVKYPFRLQSMIYPAMCNETSAHVPGSDPSGSAQFFVAIGVLAMLYTIGVSLWYVIFEVKYPEKLSQYTVDLVVTGVFVLLFFIASCAWAAGLNDVKYWTNFDNLQKNELFYQTVCSGNVVCASVTKPNYASLNVSVVFGFLNTVVWGGNLWFIYKETSFFRSRMEQKQPAAGLPPVDPNSI